MKTLSKPIIGVSCSNIGNVNPNIPNYKKTHTNEDYLTAIKKAGGIPFMIPLTHTKEEALEVVKNLHGILITGGSDINPRLYNEEQRPHLGELDPERDNADTLLIQASLDAKLPFFGICRGMQLINVLSKGSLYQDISHYPQKNILRHGQKTNISVSAHKIKLDKSSLIFDLVQEETIWVNSFHHQIIKDLAPTLKATARSSDEVIECVEMPSYPTFFIATQFHPEILATRDDLTMLKLFEGFIKAATKKVV